MRTSSFGEPTVLGTVGQLPKVRFTSVTEMVFGRLFSSDENRH